MAGRAAGLLAFGVAVVWPITRPWLPEFARAFIYDRLFFMLD